MGGEGEKMRGCWETRRPRVRVEHRMHVTRRSRFYAKTCCTTLPPISYGGTSELKQVQHICASFVTDI